MCTIYILYADDAGNTGVDYDNPNQPYFSLLGIIVDSDNWHKLDEKINNEKVKIFPPFKDIEIHTSDIFNGKKVGPVNFRKLEVKSNLVILEEIVDMIVSLNLKIIRFVVKKQNLKTYCKNVFKSQVKIDPYLIAFTYCTRFFDDYLLKNHKKGMIILDEQKSLTNNICDLLKAFKICGTDVISDRTNIL